MFLYLDHNAIGVPLRKGFLYHGRTVTSAPNSFDAFSFPDDIGARPSRLAAAPKGHSAGR